MLAFIGIVLGAVACFLTWNQGGSYSTLPFWAAIVTTVAAIWAWGVSSNYRRDPQSMPNFIPAVSMLTWVVSIALIILGIAV